MARAVLKADGDIATATCLATREQYAEPAGPAEVVVDNPAGPPFVSIVSVDAIPALGLALPTPTPEGEVFLPSLQHPGKMRGSMLSHLLACAKYLGYSQSDAWLAGATGLAFALNVRPDLLPERPGPDANHLRAAAAHYDRIVALFGPALQDDGPESYRQIIGDLGKQKAHAEKVLKPVKAELAAAGQEMEKALAAKQ